MIPFKNTDFGICENNSRPRHALKFIEVRLFGSAIKFYYLWNQEIIEWKRRYLNDLL